MPAGKGMTVMVALAAILAMAVLVAASVPLYRAFCAATGAGGTPKLATAAPGAEAPMVTVRFDATVDGNLPWRFQPKQPQVKVHLGEQTLVVFTATNLSSHSTVGRATFNVTPAKVGRYFAKIQCFCFQEQHLEGGQTVDMPVVFYVDPALARDPHANEVTTVTLSYSFFSAKAENPS